MIIDTSKGECKFCYKKIHYLATICPYCHSKNPVIKAERTYTQADVKRAKKLGISLDELDEIKSRESVKGTYGNYQDYETIEVKKVIYFFVMCAFLYLHHQIFDWRTYNSSTIFLGFTFIVPAIIIYYFVVINDWMNKFIDKKLWLENQKLRAFVERQEKNAILRKKQNNNPKKEIKYAKISECSIIIKPKVSDNGIVTFYDLEGNRATKIPSNKRDIAIENNCYLGLKKFKNSERWVPIKKSDIIDIKTIDQQ